MRPSALALLISILATAVAGAQSSTPMPKELEGVGITEHLDAHLPLDTTFFNEDSQAVHLGDYFKAGRPVIVTLVYFECPMLCTLVLNGLVDAMGKVDWVPGKEFDIVTVSFNPAETPSLARLKKESYLDAYGHDEAAKGWHFLTGSQESIHALTSTIGFGYRWDEEHKQFIHAAAIYVATPDGRLSRYLYGINFDPNTLRMSLLEAAGGKIGSPLNQIIMYCYHFDPKAGSYSLAAMRLMRIGGGLTAVVLGLVLSALWVRGRRVRV
jgi:protein SCO1